MSAQFLHNNLVKFCCARLNIFKLCILKTLILKKLNRYDLSIALCPLKEPKGSIFVYIKVFNIVIKADAADFIELKPAIAVVRQAV